MNATRERDRKRSFDRSQVVAWSIVGVVAAGVAVLFAYVYGGEVTFFGAELSGPERALGTAAATATGPALLAGAIVFGWTRPNRAVLVGSVAVAVLVSLITYLYFNPQL